MEQFDLKEEFFNSNLKYILEKDGLLSLYIDDSNDLHARKDILKFSISYFDHYLTEKEYSGEEFVCYSDLYNNYNLMSSINKVFDRFVSLYKELFEMNNDLVYADTGSIIYKSDSWEIFLRWIIDGLKESRLCILVFPKLNLFVSFGYDFTHDFFLINPSDNFFKEISLLVKKFELHIIK